jgi:hypothetical protein
MRSYKEMARKADEDLSARTKLKTYRALSARGHLLHLEHGETPKGFSLEPTDPYAVGMEEYTDQYSPEYLANLWVSDTPTTVIDNEPVSLLNDVDYFN